MDPRKEEKLRPLHDLVIIQLDPISGNEKTESGLYMPDSAQTNMARGKVVSVGPGNVHAGEGVRYEPCVKVGDRVLFNSNVGLNLNRRGDSSLRILRESELLAIESVGGE